MTPSLEDELSATLDNAAAEVRPTAPPTFSWQAPAPSKRPRGFALAGATALLGAAAVVIAVAATPDTTPDDAPAPVRQAAPSFAGTSSSTAALSTLGVPAPTRSAPRLLLAAAHTKLHAGESTVGPGEYRYIRTVGPGPTYITYDANGQPVTTPPPAGSYTLTEVWIPHDETDVWMRRDSEHGVANPEPPTTYKGRCGDFYRNTQDGSVGRVPGDACTRAADLGDPSPAFVATLPRDADALYAQLHAYAEQNLNPDKDHDVHSVMLRTVQGLLDSGMAPNDLTAALYRVLSRIPGITVVSGVTNADGVAGTGFRLTTTLGRGADATRDTTTLIVDLDSGAYLGYREVGPDQNYVDAVTVGVADELGRNGH